MTQPTAMNKMQLTASGIDCMLNIPPMISIEIPIITSMKPTKLIVLRNIIYFLSLLIELTSAN